MNLRYTNSEPGDARISVGAIEKLANMAALEVDGVSRISTYERRPASLLSRFLPKQSTAVTFNDGVASIDIGIIVKYGHRIPDVCKDVQQSVKNVVQSVTEIAVSKVNVIVCGVESDK